MEITLQPFDSLPPGVQEDVAAQVAAYTLGGCGETPQMLPVQPEAIFGKQLGVVAMDGTALAGYVGATAPQEHGGLAMTEVGTLWVPKAYRQQRVAMGLVAVISAGLADAGQTPYAFCNPQSRPVFTQSGYSEATPDEIPESAFGLCADCPMKPLAGGCCDTPMIMKGDDDAR